MGILSQGLDSRTVSGSIEVPGSPSADSVALERENFHDTETLAIVLEAPSSSQLRSSGQKLVRKIDRLSGATVVDPWSASAPSDFLQPDKALILVRLSERVYVASRNTVPKVETAIDSVTGQGVKASLLGAAVLNRELINEATESSHKSELVAIPLLIVVLLIIFRSVIAAALPLILGVSVITAGKGVLVALTALIDVDTLAVSSLSLIGLALGVDYSLVVVSRFREELANGCTVQEATEKTMVTAGRTAIMAGAIVVIGLTLITLIVPGGLLISVSASAAVAATLAVLSAVTLLPALLMLIGERVDKWRFGSGSGLPPVAGLVTRAIKRPVVVSVAVLVPLIALSIPALGLKTGPPDARSLSKDSPLTVQIEEFADDFGEGWMTPYVVLVESKDGPVTSPSHLAKIKKVQKQLANLDGVNWVVGPGALAADATTLSDDAVRGPGQVSRLSRGLTSTDRGIKSLKLGLGKASSASNQLAGGARSSEDGSRQLQSGLAQATASLGGLEQGLEKVRSSAGELQNGTSKVRSGNAKLKAAIGQAESGAASIAKPTSKVSAELKNVTAGLSALATQSQNAQAALEQARTALKAVPASTEQQAALSGVDAALGALSGIDPNTGAALQQDLTGITNSLRQLESGSQNSLSQARELALSADQLVSGLSSIQSSAGQLSSAAGAVETGSGKLKSAIGSAKNGSAKIRQGSQTLSSGAQSLTGGLSVLSGGTSRLSNELLSGEGSADKLSSGVGKLDRSVKRTDRKVKQQVAGSSKSKDRKSKRSGGKGSSKIDSRQAANSGYLTLASIAGSSKEQKRSVSFVISTATGGGAARMLVVPKEAIGNDSQKLRGQIEQVADRLNESGSASVSYGGPATALSDYDSITESRQLAVILGISLVTFLFLTALFRSVFLAAKAVVLNLLVVGVAFGVLALVAQGSSPLIGGSGYIYGIAFYMIYGTVFTLSMDYEIFIINRIREEYDRSGDNDAAVTAGINASAGIVTGAAVIMMAVFLAFAVLGVSGAQQLGIALSVAVLVDATVVRLLLLPATMRLFSRANWWIPKWLDRILPRIGNH